MNKKTNLGGTNLAQLNEEQYPPSALKMALAELESMNKHQNPLGTVRMVQMEFERMSQMQREGNLAGGEVLATTKSMVDSDRMQQRLFGERISALPESVMQQFEELIPELAQSAVRKAYSEALASGATVLEAITGELVETSADGNRRFIKSLPAPYKVELGAKRIRRAN